MNAQEYLESLLSKTLDIKEIKVSVEKLKENSAIIDWIESNQDIVAKTSPFDVCMFLQKQSIKMVSDKVRNSIIANLYDPYSIMFAICLNSTRYFMRKSSVLPARMAAISSLVNCSQVTYMMTKSGWVRLISVWMAVSRWVLPRPEPP